MKANIRKLNGPWNDGYALDKHKISSTYIGDNAQGYAQFDTLRTEVGEAVFQLKYRDDWSRSADLATAVKEHIVPLFPSIGLIVPMPASQTRKRQPVTEVAEQLAKLMAVHSFENIVIKAASVSGVKLKDLGTKSEKDAELAGRFSINDGIRGGWRLERFASG